MCMRCIHAYQWRSNDLVMEGGDEADFSTLNFEH